MTTRTARQRSREFHEMLATITPEELARRRRAQLRRAQAAEKTFYGLRKSGWSVRQIADRVGASLNSMYRCRELGWSLLSQENLAALQSLLGERPDHPRQACYSESPAPCRSLERMSRETLRQHIWRRSEHLWAQKRDWRVLNARGFPAIRERIQMIDEGLYVAEPKEPAQRKKSARRKGPGRQRRPDPGPEQNGTVLYEIRDLLRELRDCWK